MEGRHDLQPEATQGQGVTYSEVRDWAVWLNLFTADDIADAMGVDHAVGDRAVQALLWHGICEDTGDDIDGLPLIRYKPLPPGPREHPTEAPEWQTCDKEILSPRGLPIRIRSDRRTRRKLAGDMVARRQLKLQDERYQKMLRARKEREEKRKNKVAKWMREKRKNKRVDDL